MFAETSSPYPLGASAIIGPARAGKTERLLALYRRALPQLRPGEALWLSPTSRCAAEVRARLIGPGLPACLRPGVMTFDTFASSILREAESPIHPIDSVLKRQLLERLVDEAAAAGELDYFRPIVGTAGLVDLLAEFISDLKRHEVWPQKYREACRPGRAGRKDRELALLYERYQDCLNQGRLYDAEGRFWWARTLLRENPEILAPTPRLIVADGFTDFTYTQHEILEVLAARAERLLISLPLDDDAHRAELFRKSRDTLEQLRQGHPELTIEALPRPLEREWPAWRHVEAQLFRDPRVQSHAPSTDGILIGAASGQLGEIRWIARTIKRLLVEGDPLRRGATVRPGEIAVVIRGLRAVAPMLTEVFGEYGIPLALEVAPTLEQVPALALMVGLVRLAAEDWPLDDLLAIVGNSYFRPPWPEWRQGAALLDLDWVVRELQIPSGFELLAEGLARWGAASETDLTSPESELATGAGDDAILSTAQRRRAERARHARGAVGVVQHLGEALARLPERASGAVWAKALRRLSTEIGFVAGLGPPQSSERQAWERLLAMLAAEDELAQQLEQTPRTLDRNQCVELLGQLCRWERLSGGTPEAGCVRVLSAPSVRGLAIPYLFVGGLSETSFPQPRSRQFHATGEIESLRAAGVRFDPHLESAEDEMLLFYEVITRATRRLYLSYAALDESAQRLLPSPYLVEIERACGATLIGREEVLPMAAAIPTGPTLSLQELRVQATAAALEGAPSLLAAYLQSKDPAAGNLAAAWRMNASRSARDDFGTFEGLTTGESIGRALSARYHAAHRWSASELEGYAYCPYRFLLERVLRIQPLEDLRLDIDAADRGWLLHEALAAAYRRCAVDRGDPAVDAPERFRQAFAQALDELAESSGVVSPLAAAWTKINRQVLVRWCERYLVQAAEYAGKYEDLDVPPRPTLFEVSFGIPGAESGGGSVSDPLSIRMGDSELLLSGRIDRVDLASQGGKTYVNVIDYKSGAGRSAGQELDPTALQPDLYALAATELLLAGKNALPLQSGYWYLRGKGYQPALSRDPDDDEETYAARRQELARMVLGLAAGVRRGEFPVFSANPDCTGSCDFHTVCRVNQVRQLEKTWVHLPSDAS
ncbi:MAG: PD-(D/E)XK nuclease family protein [Planctomycetaceae bacterium]|nr:PD-(D/E)XK nuclease family protein [Planctomycetaceae bacterium]